MASSVDKHMRLLPCVGPRVRCQGKSLEEALIAVIDRAMIRPLVVAYPVEPAWVWYTTEDLLLSV